MMDFTGKYKWQVSHHTHSLSLSSTAVTDHLATHRAAWNEQKGVSAEEAKSKYVEHYIALLDKDGSESSMKLKAEVQPPPLYSLSVPRNLQLIPRALLSHRSLPLKFPPTSPISIGND